MYATGEQWLPFEPSELVQGFLVQRHGELRDQELAGGAVEEAAGEARAGYGASKLRDGQLVLVVGQMPRADDSGILKVAEDLLEDFRRDLGNSFIGGRFVIHGGVMRVLP